MSGLPQSCPSSPQLQDQAYILNQDFGSYQPSAQDSRIADGQSVPQPSFPALGTGPALAVMSLIQPAGEASSLATFALCLPLAPVFQGLLSTSLIHFSFTDIYHAHLLCDCGPGDESCGTPGVRRSSKWKQ